MVKATLSAIIAGFLIIAILSALPGCALTDMTGETYAWTVEDQNDELEHYELRNEHLETDGDIDHSQRAVLQAGDPAPAPTEEAPDDRSLWEVLAEFWSSPPVLVLRVAATIAGFVI